MNLSPKYFAKILLFGEYGVIRDAMALSIPYTRESFDFPTVKRVLTSANPTLRWTVLQHTLKSFTR